MKSNPNQWDVECGYATIVANTQAFCTSQIGALIRAQPWEADFRTRPYNDAARLRVQSLGSATGTEESVHFARIFRSVEPHGRGAVHVGCQGARSHW